MANPHDPIVAGMAIRGHQRANPKAIPSALPKAIKGSHVADDPIVASGLVARELHGVVDGGSASRRGRDDAARVRLRIGDHQGSLRGAIKCRQEGAPRVINGRQRSSGG